MAEQSLMVNSRLVAVKCCFKLSEFEQFSTQKMVSWCWFWFKNVLKQNIFCSEGTQPRFEGSYLNKLIICYFTILHVTSYILYILILITFIHTFYRFYRAHTCSPQLFRIRHCSYRPTCRFQFFVRCK